MGCGRLIGQTKGGMNTRLRAICDSQWLPVNLLVTAGQFSDDVGAHLLLGSFPNSNGSSGIAATMLTGPEKRCETRGHVPAFRV